MATVDISLPEDLKALALDQASKRGFGSAGEYVMSLVREALERQEASERLDALLLEGLDSGPAIPLDKQAFERIRKEGKRLYEEGRKKR